MSSLKCLYISGKIYSTFIMVNKTLLQQSLNLVIFLHCGNKSFLQFLSVIYKSYIYYTE